MPRKSARKSARELKAILDAAKQDALSGEENSTLQDERKKALNYYLGDVSDDMPTVDGRSRVVSMDVSDTIEGMMPPLMDIFCGSDEVVQFAPVGPEDIEAAEQETDYVNHVFMQQNPGFLILYSFIKDALLSKVGIVKVWWDEGESEERKRFFDQDPDAFAMIVNEPGIEVIEQAEHDGLHDVTVSCKQKYARCRIEPVPPEEFGVARNTRSLRDCDYCFHEVQRTESELIEQGYDAEQVRKLPSYSKVSGTEEQARDTVEESSKTGDEGLNKALRKIRVVEHYIRCDYEGDGKARLYRITTGGEQGDVLIRDGEPDIVEEDMIRFAAMTPIIMTHRFFGRSIADIVIDLQQIKTALTRGGLDNIYLALGPRAVVAETLANENTLDDLLVSRPGGIVRAKGQGAVEWQTVPDVSAAVYPALQYFDQVREWRTGLSRQGQGLDAEALVNQTATATNQLFAAALARQKLIARIFAETGIKDLFWLIHATVRKHGSKVETVRLRNKWVPVDPRRWKARQDLTINVGLGGGGKEMQLAEMQLIGAAQEKLIQAKLVSPRNLYNSAKELVKLTGRKDPDQYFTQPGGQPDQNDPASAPIEPPPDPKIQEIQMQGQLKTQEMQQAAQFKSDEMQQKAGIEQVQAEADIATNQQKIAAEMQMKEREFEMKRELAYLEFQLKQQESEREQARQDRENEAKVQALREGAMIKAATAEHGAALKERQAEAASSE